MLFAIYIFIDVKIFQLFSNHTSPPQKKIIYSCCCCCFSVATDDLMQTYGNMTTFLHINQCYMVTVIRERASSNVGILMLKYKYTLIHAYPATD